MVRRRSRSAGLTRVAGCSARERRCAALHGGPAARTSAGTGLAQPRALAVKRSRGPLPPQQNYTSTVAAGAGATAGSARAATAPLAGPLAGRWPGQAGGGVAPPQAARLSVSPAFRPARRAQRRASPASYITPRPTSAQAPLLITPRPPACTSCYNAAVISPYAPLSRARRALRKLRGRQRLQPGLALQHDGPRLPAAVFQPRLRAGLFLHGGRARRHERGVRRGLLQSRRQRVFAVRVPALPQRDLDKRAHGRRIARWMRAVRRRLLCADWRRLLLAVRT